MYSPVRVAAIPEHNSIITDVILDFKLLTADDSKCNENVNVDAKVTRSGRS